MSEDYWIKVHREDTEFNVTEWTSPEDRFGKKVLSILLMQIAEDLQRQVEASASDV